MSACSRTAAHKGTFDHFGSGPKAAVSGCSKRLAVGEQGDPEVAVFLSERHPHHDDKPHEADDAPCYRWKHRIQREAEDTECKADNESGNAPNTKPPSAARQIQSHHTDITRENVTSSSCMMPPAMLNDINQAYAGRTINSTLVRAPWSALYVRRTSAPGHLRWIGIVCNSHASAPHSRRRADIADVCPGSGQFRKSRIGAITVAAVWRA